MVRELKTVWDDIFEDAHQQGLQQGLVLEAQEAVLEALEVKFERIPEQLRFKIKNIQDRELLKKLHRLAIIIQDLADFEKSLPN